MDKAVQPAPAGRRVLYERRSPEETTFYQVVQEYLETFLAQVEAETGVGLPDFVKEEFDAFLECGILAHGFLRLRCADCVHEKLVACEASIPGLAGNVHVAPTPAAFSCKRRGFCPTCGARRMAETAAHLVDHVIPRVKVTAMGALVSDPASLSVRFTSPSAHARVAGDPRGYFDISDQTSGTQTHRSRDLRGHPDPAFRLGRQSQHPSALAGSRWGLFSPLAACRYSTRVERAPTAGELQALFTRIIKRYP
jgi:hypothetical protein